MGLLNVDGYYNSLLSFIDKAVEEGFVSPSARQIIVSAPTAKELMKKLEVLWYTKTIKYSIYTYILFLKFTGQLENLNQSYVSLFTFVWGLFVL